MQFFPEGTNKLFNKKVSAWDNILTWIFRVGATGFELMRPSAPKTPHLVAARFLRYNYFFAYSAYQFVN